MISLGELVSLPTIDSTRNKTINDVIGNKDDTIAGDSIISYVKSIYPRLIAVAKTYPTMVDGVSVAKDNGAWVLGPLVEIVPANTINSTFNIVAIHFDSISASGTYEMILYQGAQDVEIGRVRFNRFSLTEETSVSIPTPTIPKNSRIRAAIAGKFIGIGIVVVSLQYVQY
jgi:hypothetical protein